MIKYVIGVGLVLLIVAIIIITKKNKSNSKPKEEKYINIVPINQLFSIPCTKYVNKVYYRNQSEIGTYFRDIRKFDVFWDNRYADINTNSICIGGKYQHQLYMDTRSAGPVTYGGPQSTLVVKTYERPWKNESGLMMQFKLDYIKYKSFSDNPSGNILFNLFVENRNTGKRLNILVTAVAFGHAWTEEQHHSLFDPTTNTIFINSTINSNNKFSSMDKFSSKIMHRSGTFGLGGVFFRSIITYENFNNILKETGLNGSPEEWSLVFIGIQTEVEENSGKAIIEAGFGDFEAYTIKEI